MPGVPKTLKPKRLTPVPKVGLGFRVWESRKAPSLVTIFRKGSASATVHSKTLKPLTTRRITLLKGILSQKLKP